MAASIKRGSLTFSMAKKNKNYDSIKPKHYNVGDTYEVFNVLDAWNVGTRTQTSGFYLGTVVKYIARAGVKPDADYLEDLRKARVYLQREIDNEKGRRK